MTCVSWFAIVLPAKHLGYRLGVNELVPVPKVGRRFTASRRVRFGDADQVGRLRLDSIARYMQDVSNDDSRDLGADTQEAWVVRRTTIAVETPIRAAEMIELTTFCGGIGSRWAERRTSIRGENGGRIETASLWVYLENGRPSRLPAEFLAAYGEAAGGRAVPARLHLPGPPPDAKQPRLWPLRSSDLDGLNHVNNAATWEAVEDELFRQGLVAVSAELEYRDAIEIDDEVELLSQVTAANWLFVWLIVAGKTRATAEISTEPRKSVSA